MKTIQLLPFLAAAAISTVTATTCNRSNARAWPKGADSCNGNAACINLALEGQCNAQTYIDGGKCVKKRATALDCGASEACYLYTDGDLLCINWTSGAYRDSAGGAGNAFSGIYTYSDGSVTTNLGGTATTRRATTTTGTAATGTRTSTPATATAATTTGAGFSGQQTTAAAARTNAASDFLHRGAAAAANAAVAAGVVVLLAA